MRDCSTSQTEKTVFCLDTFPIFGQERMVQVGNPVQRKFDVTIYAMNQLGLIKTFISNARGYLTTFLIA